MAIEELNPQENQTLEISPPIPEEAPPTVEMSLKEVRSIVESLLFASQEPITGKRLSEIIGVEKGKVLEALKELHQEYDTSERAFQIEEIAGGFQLLSRPQYYSWVYKLERKNLEAKLSPAAMETLAIIAYKQPILRSTIEAIRGVESSQVLRALIEKGLVKIVGRDEALGRPLLYGTTKKFLEFFGLKSLQDLPRTQSA